MSRGLGDVYKRQIIAFGERIVGVELAKDIVKAYLTAEFEGGRHAKRIAMISDIEARN